jgi:hypothetical protein
MKKRGRKRISISKEKRIFNRKEENTDALFSNRQITKNCDEAKSCKIVFSFGVRLMTTQKWR